MEQATTNGDRRKLAVGLKAASTNPRIAIAPASLRLSGEYAAMVEESGGEPIILERGPRGFEQLKSSHGLIMTSITVVSGFDVPQKLYTTKPNDSWHWQRHPQQAELADWLWDIVCWAEENEHPTFAAGLCAQLLVVKAGGRLLSDIDGHKRPDQNKPEGGVPLQMEITPGGWVADVLKPTVNNAQVEIYCSHHQVPDEGSLPDTVRVAGRTQDNLPHAWGVYTPQGKLWARAVQSEPQHVEDPGYGRAMVADFINPLKEQ
jgi:gamma-glutamyl-gamma-aminobutyrate hydrolase PuuD